MGFFPTTHFPGAAISGAHVHDTIPPHNTEETQARHLDAVIRFGHVCHTELLATIQAIRGCVGCPGLPPCIELQGHYTVLQWCEIHFPFVFVSAVTE